MLELMQNKLVFLATHRLHWLSAMDTVLVLQEGHLLAQGSPETLIQQGAIKVAHSPFEDLRISRSAMDFAAKESESHVD